MHYSVSNLHWLRKVNVAVSSPTLSRVASSAEANMDEFHGAARRDWQLEPPARGLNRDRVADLGLDRNDVGHGVLSWFEFVFKADGEAITRRGRAMDGRAEVCLVLPTTRPIATLAQHQPQNRRLPQTSRVLAECYFDVTLAVNRSVAGSSPAQGDPEYSVVLRFGVPAHRK